MTGMLRIAVLYAVFAAVATGANLGVQAVVVALLRGQPYAIAASVAAGTVVGLPVKYLLDRNYIFRADRSAGRRDATAFALYATTAVVTTAVFWGSEALAEWLTHSEALRLVGGAIGLAIGYVLKYRLDKRFVFTGMPMAAKGWQ